MKLYLSIIGIGTIILSILNGIFAYKFGITAPLAVLYCVLAVLACIGIDAVVALVVRLFPQKNFDPEKPFFREGKHEVAVYEKLGIKKWKDLIPETGKLLVKFGKSKIEERDNPTYLYKFLTELGYAEIMHWISTMAGFLVIICFPLKFAFVIGLPVALINFFLQIPPALVQRYNRPRLNRIYKRILARKSKKENQKND